MADQVEEPTALAAAVVEAAAAAEPPPPPADAIKEEQGSSRPRGGSSSSSDDEGERLEAVKKKVYRLFGREQSVHHALGGGKSADILLWRDKKASAIVVGGATTVWVLFELVQYHLLTLLCHILMLGLAVLFFWSYVSGFINKSPPRIPEVSLSEDLSVKIALALRQEINNGLYSLRDIATGRNLKNFLGVIAGLWVVSIIGGWFNLLTLLYIVFILLHTLPLLYEKHDEKVDSFAEKAMVEIKKHYAVLDDKVLSKIPRGPLKDKKH